MKRIAFMWRLAIRKIFALLVGTVAGLTFGACPDYGVPGTPILTGQVKGNNEEAVPGIKVSISQNRDKCNGKSSFTDENGRFFIEVCENNHTVLFEDVDGPLNGAFKTQTKTGVQNGMFLEIKLEPKE